MVFCANFSKANRPKDDTNNKKNADGPEKFRAPAYVMPPFVVAADIEHQRDLHDVLQNQ